MYGIKDEDFAYISGKYHGEPHNIMSRFIRRDEIFDPSTGLAPDALEAGMLENDKLYADRPHSVRKARATAYILANTRISCDRRDRFPALNSTDRLISRTLTVAWRAEAFKAYPPELNRELNRINSSAAASLWIDFDHSVPVWDDCFRLGFRGLKERAEKAGRDFAASHPDMTEKQKGFYESISIVYDGMLNLFDRLQKLAAATEGSERMAASLGRLRDGVPETLYDVLMYIYVYFMVSEHIDGLQVRSLSNLDRMLYPYYLHDLERGGTEQEAREDIAYFFYQWQAIDNYWGQPVYFGGRNADGTTAINEMSYILLDVYDKMGIMNPKIQLKADSSTPKAWIRKAMDMIRRGHNSIVFVNHELMQRALMRYGESEDEARMADVRGCYEYAVSGSMSSGMNYVNLIKPLEYTLNCGKDMFSGHPGGGPAVPEDYATFEEFFETYKTQLRDLIERCRQCVNGFEVFLDEINPQPLLAASFPHALETALDPYGGGGTNNKSNMMFGFIANAADSLAAVRKYVFEEKRLTIPELRQILLADWEGNEMLRREIFAHAPHWGNNDDRVDRLAVEIVETAAGAIIGKPNARGDTWVCGAHVARQSYDQGRKTAATPDGRHKGEELSKNISPSMGCGRSGVTAEILSATKLDATTLKGDASLDVGIHPTAVRGDDGLDAMVGLLDTFLARGGHAMHINVFDSGSLRDAQEHPDRYPDLQIRVCGWNVLWNNINKKEQDKFILQAEALLA